MLLQLVHGPVFARLTWAALWRMENDLQRSRSRSRETSWKLL